MNVKIKPLVPQAVIPKYATPGSAGFDFHATVPVTIMPGETKLVPTGLSFQLPENVELQVRPRSGLSLKTGIRVANSPGTADEDFRGEVKVILHNTGTIPFYVEMGDRIAQGVIVPVIKATFEVVEELDQTERGANGFGSSGK